MSHWDESHLPDDLNEVEGMLHENRAEASPLELDEIKQRARAKAAKPSRRKGPVLKSRGIAAVLAVALMAAGTGGVIANGNGNTNGGASNSQYKPGCGPKKSNGVNPSGTHTGQPGKDPNRGDCPH